MVERFFNRLGQIGGGLILSGIVLTRFTFVVDGGERAVMFNKIRGVQNKVYGEGMHLLVPVLMVSQISSSNNCIGTKEIRSQIKTSDYSLKHRY
jgi:hypothetical protein